MGGELSWKLICFWVYALKAYLMLADLMPADRTSDDLMLAKRVTTRGCRQAAI